MGEAVFTYGDSENPSPGVKMSSSFSRIVSSLTIVASLIGANNEAQAAGLTTHIVIGEMALKKKPIVLGVDLTKYRDHFRYGTSFPDILLKFLQDNNASRDQVEHWSHGGRWVTGTWNLLLAYYKKNCFNYPNHISNTKCDQTLAFLMGVLNHGVADDTWHRDFVFKELEKECPDMEQDKSLETGPRHMFADKDIDICLARRVNGETQDAGILPGIPGIGGPRSKSCAAPNFRNEYKQCHVCPSGASWDHARRKAGSATPCRKSTEITEAAKPVGKAIVCDVLNGHFKNVWGMAECYQCGNGYNKRPLKNATAPDACVKQQVGYVSSAILPKLASGCVLPAHVYFEPCYSCKAEYQKRPSYPADSPVACESTQTVQCSKIPADSLGIEVAAVYHPLNMKGFDKRAFHDMKDAVDSSFGAFVPAVKNESSAWTTWRGKFLTGLSLEHHAAKIWASYGLGEWFTNNANKCEWGMKNVATAKGGLNDSRDAVVAFFKAFEEQMTRDSGGVAITRDGYHSVEGMNQCVTMNGAREHCVYPAKFIQNSGVHRCHVYGDTDTTPGYCCSVPSEDANCGAEVCALAGDWKPKWVGSHQIKKCILE